MLAADASAYTIEGLTPDEALVLGVAAVIGQRVGEAVTLSARTNAHSGHSVTGLHVDNVSSRRIRIAWLPVSRATGYKITWRSVNGRRGYGDESGGRLSVCHWRSLFVSHMFCIG